MTGISRVYGVIIVLVLGALSIGSVEVRADPPPATSAEIRDAQWYAHDQGVDMLEALRRLNLAHAESHLQGLLEKQEQATYAGLWIQHQPAFRIIAAFTQHGETTLRPYIAHGPWADLVDIRTVPVSLADLKERLATVQRVLTPLNIPFNAAVNVKQNRVEVYVTDPDLLGAAQLPPHVVVLKVDQVASPEAQIWGGERINSCTTGFGVRNASGTRYISMAAHCPDSQTYSGTTLQWVGERRGGSYDIEWRRAGSLTVTNLINVPAGRSAITQVRRRVAFLIGEQTCIYGGWSGYKCGYIESKDFLYDGQPTWILVRKAGEDLSVGGDSGAPWFWGNTAHGMHSAGSGNDAIFMATDYFDGAGVSILTSP